MVKYMKKSKRLVFLSLIIVTLAGCSSNLLPNKNNSYVKAKNGQGLHMAPGLSDSRKSNEYSIPPTHSNGPVPVSITPPTGGHTIQTPSTYTSTF